MSSFSATFKKTCILVIFSILTLAGGSVSYSSASEIVAAPLNPLFVEWQKKMDETRTSTKKKGSTDPLNSDASYGYAPSPINWSHLENEIYSVVNSAGRMGTNPVSYDLRPEMPPVRNQGYFGTCWTFSAMAASESNLIHEKKILTKDNADLSEWYLAYYGFNDESDELPSFTNGTEYPYHDVGGNDWQSVALLTRGTGSLEESSAAYPSSPDDAYKPDVITRKYKLKNSLYLGNAGSLEVPLDEGRRDLVKDAIRKYGTVSIGIMAGYDSAGYLNKETGAYYTGGKDPNHAVGLVGWDDNYSKDNFGKYKPSSDGAWIMRNSWGADWGKNGYCYVSYEEESLCFGVVYETVAAPDKEKIYQYDPLGLCNFIDYLSVDTAYFANIFRASRDEKINSVSFYTSLPDSRCTVEIYKDCGDDPIGGILVATKSLTITAPGYNTVDLDPVVKISKYRKFSVVVSISKSDRSDIVIPVEYPITDYTDKAKASAGQSFISCDGTEWEDLTGFSTYKNANVCIKAFGTSEDDPANGGSSGGCTTGPGVIILMTLAVLPFACTGKKH
ncbi:MAG: lectin like domain-containing protein [Synergistota bacterium]|nr:lectin like domain-containing protein [Synergistota bacterium]